MLSADAVVHELYLERDRDAVAARFPGTVAPEGVVDRALLARARSRAIRAAWLEELVWPRVGARIAEWRRAGERADPPPVSRSTEVPLLFESGMQAAFDATIP